MDEKKTYPHNIMPTAVGTVDARQNRSMVFMLFDAILILPSQYCN